MRTKFKIWVPSLAILLMGPNVLFAQVSALGNNPPAGSYVGHVGANINPVEVRHNGNQRIQWYTDSLHRMQLWNTRYGTINGFTNRNQNGFVGISNQPLFFQDFYNASGPFSRLHLADSCNNVNDYAPYYGYRPWMKKGVTFTGNRDQGDSCPVEGHA